MHNWNGIDKQYKATDLGSVAEQKWNYNCKTMVDFQSNKFYLQVVWLHGVSFNFDARTNLVWFGLLSIRMQLKSRVEVKGT